MDLDSDDDDFEPKAKPGTKSKRRATGDSDEDFAPMKQKKKKKDEVPRKTSTQGKVDSVTATGRGGRPTARLSVEEAKFQEDLQLALRVSSEEDLDGGGGSDDNLDPQTGSKKKKAPRKVSKKETDLVVVNDEGSIVLGDSDDEEIAVAQCPNSSSTTVILAEEDGGDAKNDGEVNAKGDCENIVLEDSEDEETEVAKVLEEKLPKKILNQELLPKKNSKPKRTTVGETWVVGERSRRSSGDQRSRKKPQKYVESSDSENDLDSVIDGNESDEEFKEEKKMKQSKAKKVPLKKPEKIQVDKNSAASRTGENPAGESKQKLLEKKVLEVSPTNQPTPASPVRPFGIHNPPSPCRPSTLCTTPTPSLSLPALLKLKTGAGGSKPPSPNLHRGSPAWKPPAKVGSSLANSSSLPASPGLSPGLRRLGLSRNWKSPAPLHKNLKLSQ